MDDDITTELQTQPAAYQQALEGGYFDTLDDLYRQWEENHKRFTARFADYKPYSSKSLGQLWRTILTNPELKPYNMVIVIGAGMVLVCAITGYYLMGILLTLINVEFLHTRYKDCLDSNPYTIYGSHLTDEQHRMLQEYNDLYFRVDTNLKHHESLLNTAFGRVLKAWKTFRQMQWDVNTSRDFEKSMLTKLRSVYIHHRLNLT